MMSQDDQVSPSQNEKPSEASVDHEELAYKTMREMSRANEKLQELGLIFIPASEKKFASS